MTTSAFASYHWDMKSSCDYHSRDVKAISIAYAAEDRLV